MEPVYKATEATTIFMGAVIGCAMLAEIVDSENNVKKVEG